MPRHYNWFQGASRTLVEFQVVFWAVGGIGVLALAIADVFRRRDACSWLLALWVLGTFLFAAFFNWTVNGRSLLPMAPAVGILIARRLEQNGLSNRHTFPRGAMLCLAASAALAFLVAQSDFLLAVATRQSARLVCANYKSSAGNLWFQGHWGFQYYMEQAGAWALDVKHSRLKPGDTLALPMNNDALPLNLKDMVLQGTLFRFRAALVFDLEHPDRRRFLCVVLGTAALCRGPDATGNCVRLCFGAGGSGTAQKIRRILPATIASPL